MPRLATTSGYATDDSTHYVYTKQPLSQQSIYNTIIADPRSPYVAVCILFILRLQALALLYFTFTNDQKAEQIFLSVNRQLKSCSTFWSLFGVIEVKYIIARACSKCGT